MLIGTPESPATNVTLYLDHADCEGVVDGAREENWSTEATECSESRWSGGSMCSFRSL